MREGASWLAGDASPLSRWDGSHCRTGAWERTEEGAEVDRSNRHAKWVVQVCEGPSGQRQPADEQLDGWRRGGGGVAVLARWRSRRRGAVSACFGMRAARQRASTQAVFSSEKKFPKFFADIHHIKFYDTCMKY